MVPKLNDRAKDMIKIGLSASKYTLLYMICLKDQYSPEKIDFETKSIKFNVLDTLNQFLPIFKFSAKT